MHGGLTIHASDKIFPQGDMHVGSNTVTRCMVTNEGHILMVLISD